ncbi:MAG: hypothetical protein ACK4ND_15570 [Cytophagaceae bacterium]
MIIHRNISNILSDDDYGIQGEYLISVWTKEDCLLLSEKTQKGYNMTKIGEIVEKYWNEIPQHFNNITLKEYIVTDDKIYGIVNIDIYGKKNSNTQPVYNSLSHFEITFGMMISQKNPFLIEGSLFHIINWFKAASLIEIRKNNNTFLWKTGYYEFKLEDKGSSDKLQNIMYNLR